MSDLAEIFNTLTDNRTKSVQTVEREMLKHEQVDCPVVHRFGPGIYIREVSIPAGAIAIGHKQNFEHLNIFLKGRVSIFKDDGTIEEMKAPMIFTGQPGRKIGYIHEDVVWLNVYAETERDVEALEAKYLTKSIGWQEENDIRQKSEDLQTEIDRKDFFAAIDEFGFDAETVRKHSENKDDMTITRS